MSGFSSPRLGQIPEFDLLSIREQRWAWQSAGRWIEFFDRERPREAEDNRRRAIAMGFFGCAGKWFAIWVAFLIPASILWGTFLGAKLYWLLALPAVLTAIGVSALAQAVRRYRMMRRYYPEKFQIQSAWQQVTQGVGPTH